MVVKDIEDNVTIRFI